MRIYNLVEAAQLLSVDPATLRRWRVRAGGLGARGIADRRRVWISRLELAILARDHKRILLDTDPEPGNNVVDLVNEMVDLHTQVMDLDARIAVLEKIIADAFPGTLP